VQRVGSLGEVEGATCRIPRVPRGGVNRPVKIQLKQMSNLTVALPLRPCGTAVLNNGTTAPTRKISS
jgi:hypothetical protein